MSRRTNAMTRRAWLGTAAGVSLSGWLGGLAAAAAKDPARKRSCILLWMAGGPSQLDTFDPKPDHKNGGPVKPIETGGAGIQIGEHLPGVADQMKRLALVRSMSTREGDHGRATQHLRTGYLPQGSIQFPTFGSLVANERDNPDADLPPYVSIGPSGIGGLAMSPGFLGPRFSPVSVGGGLGDGALKVEDLDRPASIGEQRADHRLSLLRDLEADFL